MSIQNLSVWEANQLWCAPGMPNEYKTGVPAYPAGPEHYDPLRCFQSIERYRKARGLTVTDWSLPIAAAINRQRDQFQLAGGGGIQAYEKFFRGPATHYENTGDTNSRDTVQLMDDRRGAPAWMESQAHNSNSRPVAFALVGCLERERMGQAHQQVAEALACLSLQYIDQWATPDPYPWGLYVPAFMVGFTMEALIAYWDRYQGSTDTTPLNPAWLGTSPLYDTQAKIVAAIPGSVKKACDWLWKNQWCPPGDPAYAYGAMHYYTPNLITDRIPIYATVTSAVSGTQFSGSQELSTRDNDYSYALTYFFTGVNAGNYTYINTYEGSTRTFRSMYTRWPLKTPVVGDAFVVMPDSYIIYQVPSAAVLGGSTTTTVFGGPTAIAPNGQPLYPAAKTYDGYSIVFLSGALAKPGNHYRIASYTAARVCMIDPATPLPQAPAAGDLFMIGTPSGGRYPAPQLSYLIGPAYAWYYWYTAKILGAANISYRDQHDAIFDGGSAANADNWKLTATQKVYNQCYRWTFEGLAWRERGDSEWPTAITYSLTAPDPASGRANAPSGLFRVALPEKTSLTKPLTVTPKCSTGRGVFVPASVVLTNDRPLALFRFLPDALDAGTGVTITSIAAGFTAPPGVGYTVTTVAPLALGRTVTGPATVGVGTPSTFTFETVPPGSVFPPAWYAAAGGLDVVRHSDSPGGGKFQPGPPAYPDWQNFNNWISAEKPKGTFTYQPNAVGPRTLTFDSYSGLPKITTSFDVLATAPPDPTPVPPDPVPVPPDPTPVPPDPTPVPPDPTPVPPDPATGDSTLVLTIPAGSVITVSITPAPKGAS